MAPKRKAEGVGSLSEPAETPAKRTRNNIAGTPTAVNDATPQTSEKRGRGRPRKNPESSTPKLAYDGPKRGRGRPRKIVSETSPEAATPSGPKRGRGRPRKDSGDATTTTTTTTTTPDVKKKDGRGRPRKNPVDVTTPIKPTIKKDGRGRPRKNPVDATAPIEPIIKKDGRRRPRKNPLPTEAAETSPKKPAKAVLDTSNIDTNRSFWLMKAEPESRLEKGKDVKFSIDDLAAAKEPEPWDGVRNHVAKNLMREMKKGDYAFFYHSNCKVPGIVGVMEVVQEHSVDESAFDPEHPYYDPKSKRDDPRWVVVHVEYRRKLQKQVTLQDLKTHGQTGSPLESLQMIKQGRLSVSSVTPAQWRYILQLAGEKPQEEFTKVESQ